MQQHTVDLPDGRTLEAVEDGDPDGVPLLVHHGTPGAAGFHRAWVEDARSRGLRLICYSRPGYGRSTRQPGRAVDAAATEATAVCDALGVERFLSWGVSGGGPHVLACAALLPDRVVAAASLASVAPFDGPGLDWFDGMGEGNRREAEAFLAGGREANRASAEEMRAGLTTGSVSEMIDQMADFLTPVDAAVLDADLGEFLMENDRAALADGIEGWLDEDLMSPWGFDPADIRVPVLLWQGRQDAMVPFGHGAWLAQRIPGVEAHLTEEDGHLTLLTQRLPGVHAWLLEKWEQRGGS